MVSNCWYKNAGNNSGYPKILIIIQIGNIERQKENTSNYACAVSLIIPGVGLIDDTSILTILQKYNRITNYLSDCGYHHRKPNTIGQ
jgi:hypothetical protein